MIVSIFSCRWKVFHGKCNTESVDLESIELPVDIYFVKDTLLEFVQKTGSDIAKNILDNWNTEKLQFVKVGLSLCLYFPYLIVSGVMIVESVRTSLKDHFHHDFEYNSDKC